MVSSFFLLTSKVESFRLMGGGPVGQPPYLKFSQNKLYRYASPASSWQIKVFLGTYISRGVTRNMDTARYSNILLGIQNHASTTVSSCDSFMPGEMVGQGWMCICIDITSASKQHLFIQGYKWGWSSRNQLETSQLIKWSQEHTGF